MRHVSAEHKATMRQCTPPPPKAHQPLLG